MRNGDQLDSSNLIQLNSREDSEQVNGFMVQS